MSGIGPQQTSEAVQRSRVAAAIWPWRTGKEQDRARNASARRKRSLIEAAFALLVGAVLICGFYHQAIGAVALCVGVFVGVTGQLFPTVLNRTMNPKPGQGENDSAPLCWIGPDEYSWHKRLLS